MRPRNLVSVFQGDAAAEAIGANVDKRFKVLKKHEIRNLKNFCSIMQENGCGISHLDGFYVSYSIAQIGKEFDLLRFGKDYILNIELKSELKIAQKEKKILKQMHENNYYLHFLKKTTLIFTYVENDGFYQYLTDDRVIRVKPAVVARYMCDQVIDYSMDPDRLFLPSNYLISPFNSTKAFMDGNYFLTSAQEKVKEEMLLELDETPFMFFCLSANAGTGKTLTMYDIAKSFIEKGKKVLIIHCGILNQGHETLKSKYGWTILSIRNIPKEKNSVSIDDFDFIFIDESQRIRALQLTALVDKAIELNIPLFFSFDTKQYLRTGETLDISEYLLQNYPQVRLSRKKLTNKIRTNKAMASFITNMFDKGKSHDHLNYDCVTVDYFEQPEIARAFVSFLCESGWTAITFTTSSYNPDPYDDLSEFSDITAHGVIGQEFSKVVLVMDNNFRYGADGKLQASGSYYSASGMLYQIVTRVVDELKIIVLDNPELYKNLLEIKAMDTSE